MAAPTAPMTPDELASRFPIAGLTFEVGPGGLTVARVRTELAEAEIFLHGAHVARFQPSGAEPVLFLSENALFAPGKPIRGGIPICFPWFADREGHPDDPAHGFARTRPFDLTNARTQDGQIILTFEQGPDASTRKYWPGNYRLRYEVTVGRALQVSATVENAGDEPFTYELALHTYLQVGDVRQVALSGFEGTEYVSKVEGLRTTQQGEPLIDREIDRIYVGHERDVTINDPVLGRRLTVSKTGSKSTILWNPHIAKAQRMKDFGDNEWPTMLCVESANVKEHAVELAPGESARLGVVVSNEMR